MTDNLGVRHRLEWENQALERGTPWCREAAVTGMSRQVGTTEFTGERKVSPDEPLPGEKAAALAILTPDETTTGGTSAELEPPP